MTMGASVQWYSKESSQPEQFPDIKWGLGFNEQSARVVKMASGPGKQG